MNDLFWLRLRKIVWALRQAQSRAALRVGTAPSVEHLSILRRCRFDRLIDVGANRGQFSLMTRLLYPEVPIEAFEPLPEEACRYQRIFGSDSRVKLHRCALGAKAGRAEMHVSGRADSSSLLPIGDLQTALFPTTREVGVLPVEIFTLDSLPSVWSEARRALLKLDVQGFEYPVLQGATEALGHCAYVYAECSHEPLYTGQVLFPQVKELLQAHGFTGVECANEFLSGGRLIQADYLFSRNES